MYIYIYIRRPRPSPRQGRRLGPPECADSNSGGVCGTATPLIQNPVSWGGVCGAASPPGMSTHSLSLPFSEWLGLSQGLVKDRGPWPDMFFSAKILIWDSGAIVHLHATSVHCHNCHRSAPEKGDAHKGKFAEERWQVGLPIIKTIEELTRSSKRLDQTHRLITTINGNCSAHIAAATANKNMHNCKRKQNSMATEHAKPSKKT